MRILAFLVICFYVSFQQISSFSEQKQKLFLDRISHRDYYLKNQKVNILNNGKIFLITTKQYSQQTNQTYYLYATYTSSKAIYTNNQHKFIGIVIIDKSLYRTSPKKSIFDVDFGDLSVFGFQKTPFF